jgi:hypothetical protein
MCFLVHKATPLEPMYKLCLKGCDLVTARAGDVRLRLKELHIQLNCIKTSYRSRL